MSPRECSRLISIRRAGPGSGVRCAVVSVVTLWRAESKNVKSQISTARLECLLLITGTGSGVPRLAPWAPPRSVAGTCVAPGIRPRPGTRVDPGELACERTPGSRYTVIFHRREATSRPHTADPLYADCCLSLEIVTAAARARGSSHAANTAPVYSFWNVMSTEYR